jgi:hypothetical protein
MKTASPLNHLALLPGGRPEGHPEGRESGDQLLLAHLARRVAAGHVADLVAEDRHQLGLGAQVRMMPRVT